MDQFDHQFKLLLIGDSGVGKSSLLLRFTDDLFEELSPTIGVDFKVKVLTVNRKKVKLTIWDTAGQERFRTLTASYYRGAHGIILVYDVSRRETFDNLKEIWLREVEMYSGGGSVVKMLVANKVDMETRGVSKEEGQELARSLGTIFFECSAKTKVGVQNAFEELNLKILDNPEICGEEKTKSVLGGSGAAAVDPDAACYC